jgi:CheY-like chemotaxis protein
MFTHQIGLGRWVDRPRKDLPVVVAVDDDIDNLALISYVLEEFPCLLFCETDGQSALDLSLQLQPDLILLDIRLPRLNGIDMVKALRLHKDTSEIPVIAVTALADIQNRQEILQAGFNQYISKPYLLEDITTLIRRYLVLSDYA